MAIPKNVSSCTIRGTGFDGASNVQIWKKDEVEIDGRPTGRVSWRFDGPVYAAPREARRHPRGPYWRGEVSAAFVGQLVRKAKQAGYKVECTTKKGAHVLAGSRRRRSR